MFDKETSNIPEALDTATPTCTEETASLVLSEPQPINFVKQLDKMGIGMLGIFIVIALVMISTFALNKIFSGKKEN